MKLTMTGRHVEVPKSLALYVRKRFKKWSTFISPESTVHLILTVEGYRHIVEVTVKDGAYVATGKQTTKDMFRSVDLLAEKIGAQLMRQHERRLESRTASIRKPLERRTKSVAAKSAASRPAFSVETVSGKPMSHEEAMEEVKTIKSGFLVFLDMDTDQLAVITRKADGSMKLYIKE